ncbi:AVAST type 1 anti-phage system MBL fold metallo-hydrolase Avs1a [Neptunicella marina]|uniref:MBL fold metallo-hydrolase n=1 Tax=Neptunicella marina TaxID=2125989 RepID=A0A8J6IWB3_9ALTE|nr:AVAST type 1 anti-phage system MBL fold metallo-hydrolase Avs1a [Neptunicella marina]MBC3766698.1 MBL fold metallo-hydrolase [Neptunicella marina]
MKIKMYPAENGDAFLLCSDEVNILVDGGYAKTFSSYVRPDLESMANNEEHLELVIVTHIDSDHIGGIIRFLMLNGGAQVNSIIPLKGIWHNSLRALTSESEADISPSNLEVLNAIKRRGHPKRQAQDITSVDEISAKQGSTLASLIHAGQYIWNEGDGTKSVCVDSVQQKTFSNGFVKVLSPSKLRLANLLKTWKKDLRRYGFNGSVNSNQVIDDAFEFNFEHRNDTQINKQSFVSARSQKRLEDIYTPDNSIANGSSIATLIELNGTRVLMLADAWAEDVLEELQKMKSQGESMVFDAIKISHHGSNHNTSPDLLSLVDSPIYFISSNGSKHSHPDIELLREIVNREAKFTRTLYFNYSTPESREIKDFQTTSGATFIVEENAIDWIEITKEYEC